SFAVRNSGKLSDDSTGAVPAHWGSVAGTRKNRCCARSPPGGISSGIRRLRLTGRGGARTPVCGDRVVRGDFVVDDGRIAQRQSPFGEREKGRPTFGEP